MFGSLGHVITKLDRFYYKMDSFFITKCDKSLLQNASDFLLQNATKVYYKMHQIFYCKMRQLLQNATVVTKYNVYYKLHLKV